MHKILFIGGFFPKEFTKEILQNSIRSIQNSSNRLQWLIIDGLKINNIEVDLITAPFIGSFPKYYKKIYFKLDNLEFERTKLYIIQFLNLPFIKNLFKIFYIFITLFKHYYRNESKNNYIIIYSLNISYILPVILYNLFLRNKLKICVIITDLPIYPGDSSILYRYYLKYIEQPIFNYIKSGINSYVLLTKPMSDKLKLNDKPSIIIEGMINIDYKTSFSTDKKNNITHKTILYTGTLDKRYGIIELIESFKLINNEFYKLIICGSGSLQDLIKYETTIDSRINYLGNLTIDEVANLQSEATLLVNPRNNKGEFNKYSFPSKTLEYFASGTPVLMYKLDGIPNEYYNYCFTIEDNSNIQTLSNKIIEICELDTQQLDNVGNLARQFVLEKKNNVIQTKRILDFFDSLS